MDEFAALYGEIMACRLCRDQPLKGLDFALPHEPRPVVHMSKRAKILIAGQAPGKRVHESGLPFDDASGDRLRDWLNVDRQKFYDRDRFAIVPMGFCFPGYDAKGADLPPRKECAPKWRSKVLALMPQIELVLAIGLYAQGWHLGALRQKSLTETVSQWQRYALANGPGPVILPLPHPSWRNSAWLKRNAWFEAELLPFLKKKVDQLAQ